MLSLSLDDIEKNNLEHLWTLKEVSRVLDARWNLLDCAKQVFFVFVFYIYILERAKNILWSQISWICTHT